MATLRGAPAQPLDLPITALFGLDDRNATGAEVAAWTGLSTRRSSSHGIPGGHFYYQTARAATLDILNNALESDLRGAVTPVGG
jgi:medium-chain acyl-[acyl-carrier-protein] hydrolase